VLEDIGADVTSSADGKNGKVYVFGYVSSNRVYRLRACPSEGDTRVWVGLPLRAVDRAAAAADAEALFNLLGRNQEVGPRHFKISGGTLLLGGAAENRDVGSARVRQLVEQPIADAERTRKDWDRDWTGAAGPATPKRGD
jgi:hypothetical protein